MHALTAQPRVRFRTEDHSRIGRFVPQALKVGLWTQSPQTKCLGLADWPPRNYGDRPNRSMVKLGEKRL